MSSEPGKGGIVRGRTRCTCSGRKKKQGRVGMGGSWGIEGWDRGGRCWGWEVGWREAGIVIPTCTVWRPTLEWFKKLMNFKERKEVFRRKNHFTFLSFS